MTEGLIQLGILITYEFVVAFLTSAFTPMEKSRKKTYLFMAFFPLAMMTMLHSWSVGNDTIQYINIFKKYRNYTWSQLFLDQRFEHGFLAFNWLIGKVTSNPQWVFVITGSLLYISLFRWVNKYIDAPGLFVILLVEMLIFDYWISAQRQVVATVFLLIAFDAITEKKLLRFIILVLFASVFHNVALLFLIAYPIINFSPKARKKPISFEIIILVATLVILLFLEIILRSVVVLFPTYEYYLNSVYADGKARLAVILNLVVYSLMLFVPGLIERQISDFRNEEASIRALYYLGLINVELTVLANSATLFARVASIFTQFGIAYYCVSVSKLQINKNRQIMNGLTVVSFAVYAFIITALKTPEWQQTYPFTWFWSR